MSTRKKSRDRTMAFIHEVAKQRGVGVMEALVLYYRTPKAERQSLVKLEDPTR